MLSHDAEASHAWLRTAASHCWVGVADILAVQPATLMCSGIDHAAFGAHQTAVTDHTTDQQQLQLRCHRVLVRMPAYKMSNHLYALLILCQVQSMCVTFSYMPCLSHAPHTKPYHVHPACLWTWQCHDGTASTSVFCMLVNAVHRIWFACVNCT